MAPHLLQRERMSTWVRAALPLFLLASGCNMEFEHGSVHVHDHRAPQRPPILESRPLHFQVHGPDREAAPSTLLPGPRRITQKVLLLTGDDQQPSYLAARDALVRIGVPFQALNAVTQDVTDALLTDQQSTCHFSAIIYATSGLGYNDPTHGWISALSAEEWQRLAAFQLACDAREAVWYAWPSADLGLSLVSAFDFDQPVLGTIASPQFFTRVPATAQLRYHYAAGYRAAILDPSRTRAIVTDAAGNVLVATHRRPDGSEVLVSTVDSSPYLPHALALEYDMIRWLTRGVFIGKKQTYLTAQIDDVFLGTDMWRLDLHANPKDGANTLRISGSDLLDTAAWQASLLARLPAGSSFQTVMAYNGYGTERSYSSDRTLVTAARDTGSVFQWLNHTWDHENMNTMTRIKAREEVALNCTRGQALGLHGLSCDELVTPEISGLKNREAVRGMVLAGVRYAVSDTSQAASNPQFADAPGDNPSFNVGRVSTLDSRLYLVPRHPTNVFYDVSNPAEMVDSYNVRFPGNATYEEIVDLNTSFPLLYLLQGDIDPLMFHQANIATFDAANRRSLYSDFVEALMAKYLAFSSAPVLTLSQRAIGEAMKARGKLDTCNPSATIVESANGRALELRSTAACTIPLSGLSAPQAGSVEYYANEPITSITFPSGGGAVTLPL